MTHDMLIRERAYLLWEQAGRPEGTGEEFWHAAIASLAAETVVPKSGRSKTQPNPAASRKAGAAISSRVTMPASTTPAPAAPAKPRKTTARIPVPTA